MSAPPPRLSRLYLIPAGLAVLLGLTSVAAHLRQPSIPGYPGKGCLITAIPGPDTVHLPSPWLELQACTHISETVYSLEYFPAPEEGPVPLFDASGPEDPRRWPEFLQIRWRVADTVEVGHDRSIYFRSRTEEHRSLHIRYVPLHEARP